MGIGTSTINIPVTTFNQLSTGLMCVIGTMTATGDSRVTIVNNGIVVKPVSTITDTLNLCFTVAVSGPGGSSYKIAGVVFGGAGTSTIFTGQGSNSSGAVTVTDALNTQGAWEFYVIVQQGSGGNIGLIDPPIENDQAT